MLGRLCNSGNSLFVCGGAQQHYFSLLSSEISELNSKNGRQCDAAL